MTSSSTTSDIREAMLRRLEAFGDAWRRGDVDALMDFMADDCEFRSSVGEGPGAVFRGREEVRRGFELMLAYDDAGEGRSGVPVIDGDRVASQWVLEPRDGGRTVYGCDLFAFEGELIRLKDAYRKVYDKLT
jgi:hypothetical protein